MVKKRVDWWRGTKEKLASFPEEAKHSLGFDLRLAQYGRTGQNSKPLRGFSGAGVMEIVHNGAAGAFRVVYTTKSEDAVIVLHVFQKKSVRGKATPKADMQVITQRFKEAGKLHGF